MNRIQKLNEQIDQLFGKVGDESNPTLLNRPSDIEGNIKLGSAEIAKVREAFMRVVNFQIENGCCLTTMSLAFLVLDNGGILSRGEASALADLAKTQAERSRYHINLIRKIID